MDLPEAAQCCKTEAPFVTLPRRKSLFAISLFSSILIHLLTLDLSLAAEPVNRQKQAKKWSRPDIMRGVVYSSWDGSYREQGRWKADLEYFDRLGVGWIQIMTFARQPDVEGPMIHSNSATRWPSSFVRAARKKGIKILLKPHVWSPQFYDGSRRWRGSIRMKTEADWAAWFKFYAAFIIDEAKRAESFGIEAFSIGLEYVEATRSQTARWRALIKEIRSVYSGALTYSADGNHEAGHIGFWDQLDFIGINAYFSLGTPSLPGGFDLDAAWAAPLSRIQKLQAKHSKPVVFTEAGYASRLGCTSKPWQWPSRDDKPAPELQAQAYESLFRVWSKEPYFQGLFWWKFYEKPEKGVPHSVDYSPRGKPAENVLRKWYKSP